MLKTSTSRFNNASPRFNSAQKHLWDDFVQQVASYARRQTIAHKGRPLNQRVYGNRVAASTWYNSEKAR